MKKIIKRKNVLIFVLVFFMVLISIIFFIKYNLDNNLLSKYNNKIIPGIYLNDTNLEGVRLDDLDDVINNKLKSGVIIISNVNGDYEYPYDQVGIMVDTKKIKDEISNYVNNIPRYKKVRMIKEKKKVKTFYLNGYLDSDTFNSFSLILKQKMDTFPKSNGLMIDDNHNVTYNDGVNGFILDLDKLKKSLEESTNNLGDKIVVEALGEVTEFKKQNEELSKINKKISSYTTYFSNKGNRGHNIFLASNRLNGTIIMPNETFSYLKVIGPYGASNGYLPAPIYLNSKLATANGGGVCQLASTLYMAQLKAGLETVYRTNHTFAPDYVPKGLDATVYSTTVDYKFKNQYEYPIYIVSYVTGNNLTVDIWTNENALGGKTFEPYSVYKDGAYYSYLKVIENGNVIETKYLDRSFYKTH